MYAYIILPLVIVYHTIVVFGDCVIELSVWRFLLGLYWLETLLANGKYIVTRITNFFFKSKTLVNYHCCCGELSLRLSIGTRITSPETRFVNYDDAHYKRKRYFPKHFSSFTYDFFRIYVVSGVWRTIKGIVVSEFPWSTWFGKSCEFQILLSGWIMCSPMIYFKIYEKIDTWLHV